MNTISSLSHPLVKYFVDLKKDRATRIQHQSLLLEGKNAIIDLSKKQKAKRLLIDIDRIPVEEIDADEIIFVTRDIIKKISSVENPDCVIAEFAMPKMGSLIQKNRIIACDQIQDPGNLGTIIRSSLALGWDGLFLIEPCCDPFNDKALRAAKGATFELPLQRGTWEDLSHFEHQALVADVQGEKPEQFIHEKKILLIVGNEGQGVYPPENFPHKKVSIPMPGPMESLNVAVASSILMYALRPL